MFRLVEVLEKLYFAEVLFKMELLPCLAETSSDCFFVKTLS